ncbi:hypothetical protein QSI_3101 [Clostridioides difficile P28]|nr:hypothetical protein QSI_3101 [Clostridioides difficile P28]
MFTVKNNERRFPSLDAMGNRFFICGVNRAFSDKKHTIVV